MGREQKTIAGTPELSSQEKRTDHANEKLNLVSTADKLTQALMDFVYFSKRAKYEKMDHELIMSMCLMISHLKRYRNNVLLPSTPDEDGTDDYIHPFCKSFQHAHEE